MKKTIIVSICLLSTCVSAVLLNKLLVFNSAIAQSQNVVPTSIPSMVNSSFNFNRRSLIDALPQEVGQVALDYTRARFKVLSGTPNIIVARRATTNDLSNLGFPTDEYDPQDYPLMLVVLKGNFDVSSMRRRADSKWHKQVEYIAYLFDLRAGVPTLTQTSAKGGIFRNILKEPSLSDDPVANPEGLEQLQRMNLTEAIPVPLEQLPTEKLPYGSTAPYVSPPKDLPPSAPSNKPVQP